jgi:DNA helicase IV
MVETRRDEDKQQLASDEAVGHSLSHRQKAELSRLERLLRRPYFARFSVEEVRDGKPVTLTYKVGFETNVDCRIIDWRDAPLSKLFYHYDEKEEYCELIQETEREGILTAKTRLAIADRTLLGISSSDHEFCTNGAMVWQTGASDQQRSFFHLPDVLSLITPEQFSTITEDAHTAVLIQGIAGSGKSTVGLYRLAWLLRAGKAEATSSAIVLRNPALKEYIQRSLPSIHLENVNVLTTMEWITLRLSGSLTRPEIQKDKVHYTIARLKNDFAFASFMMGHVAQSTSSSPSFDSFNELIDWYHSHLTSAIEHYQPSRVKEHADALRRVETNNRLRKIDYLDLPLALLCLQRVGYLGYLPGGLSGHFTHMVVDEVQDLNQILLTTIVQSVENPTALTLLGDQAQDLSKGHPGTEDSGFPGWERLRQLLNLPSDKSKYLTLDISFRCSLPIMRLSEYFSDGRVRTNNGRPGKTPIWFHATKGDTALVHARDWLDKALRRYPLALTAVLCKSHQEARQVYHLLEPYFKNTIHLGSKEGFSSSDGIVVTSISASKGLEFFNVLIWNCSAGHFRGSQRHDRNLAYVASTRARENLSVVSWFRMSDMAPGVHSKLIRYVDCDSVDGDEEEG